MIIMSFAFSTGFDLRVASDLILVPDRRPSNNTQAIGRITRLCRRHAIVRIHIPVYDKCLDDYVFSERLTIGDSANLSRNYAWNLCKFIQDDSTKCIFKIAQKLYDHFGKFNPSKETQKKYPINVVINRTDNFNRKSVTLGTKWIKIQGPFVAWIVLHVEDVLNWDDYKAKARICPYYARNSASVDASVGLIDMLKEGEEFIRFKERHVEERSGPIHHSLLKEK